MDVDDEPRIAGEWRVDNPVPGELRVDRSVSGDWGKGDRTADDRTAGDGNRRAGDGSRRAGNRGDESAAEGPESDDALDNRVTSSESALCHARLW